MLALALTSTGPTICWAAEDCAKSFKALEPVSEKDSAAVIAWLKKEDHYEEGADIYRTDINNDGKPDWVVGTYGGSGHYLNVDAYSQDGKDFKALEIPLPVGIPEVDGGWYSFDYFHSPSGKHYFLLEACGKTYMVFSGDSDGSSPGYLWKDGKNNQACDDTWLEIENKHFSDYYSKKTYDLAYNSLSTFYNTCRAKLSPESQLRVIADLSVSAYHNKDHKHCLSYIEEAKKIKEFSASKFSKPILYNETLCTKSVSQPAKLKPTTAKKLVKQIEDAPSTWSEVISSSVPVIDSEKPLVDSRAAAWKEMGIANPSTIVSHSKFDLREFVRSHFTGPAGNSKIHDGKVVVKDGCIAHSCSNLGMIWVEANTGNSFFAINTFPFSEEHRNCVTIGSRTVDMEPKKTL